jgi:hypothetical protein
VLKVVLTGPAEKKIPYSLCLEGFRPEDQKSKRKTFKPNRKNQERSKITWQKVKRAELHEKLSRAKGSSQKNEDRA